jgi:hypothetical protein
MQAGDTSDPDTCVRNSAARGDPEDGLSAYADRALLAYNPGVVRSVSLLVLLAVGLPARALAHDLRLPLEELQKGAQRLSKTLAHYRTFPAIAPMPETEDQHRRVIGAAEIELALGNHRRALEMLMGRLADPHYQTMPQYVETLNFTSQILETTDEDIGAMQYAELALRHGGTPDQMAEAGARWFRLARRHQRLDRRLEIYELWRASGGEKAAGSEVACQVAYEVAFALRADGHRREARQLLSRVPSDSAYGSRAAYLAGVLFVEDGDLQNAERWFSAIMEWPLPPLKDGDPQMEIEVQTRSLASLAAGRLLYEKGDLEAAADAYDRIPAGSPWQPQACWERAFLDLDRRLRRGALKSVQCVLDLGAEGPQFVNARLFRASLLAHLSRYSDSIESYKLLHQDMERQRDLFVSAAKSIEGPGEFLFTAMERNAIQRGKDAAPGPATLFGGAWTPEVDQAYRVDRGAKYARGQIGSMNKEMDAIDEVLSREDAFVVLDVRRQQLQRLLREIQHLLGHAGDLEEGVSRHQASLGLFARDVAPEHREDARALASVVRDLNELEGATESDLRDLDRLEKERRDTASRLMKEIRGELAGIEQEIAGIEKQAVEPVDGVARRAIEHIKAALQDAAMKAEVGVLDTFWLKKEHRTQAIESLLDQKKEMQRQANEAATELFEVELPAEPDADSLPINSVPLIPEPLK